MDKYQKYILEKYGIRSNFIFYRCNPIVENKLVNEGIVQYGEFNIESDSFTIKQDEDINLLEYALVLINKIDIFRNIAIYKPGVWTDIALTMENKVPSYKIIANFNDRIEKIKFGFKNQLADDYIITINYQDADKEKYYAMFSTVASSIFVTEKKEHYSREMLSCCALEICILIKGFKTMRNVSTATYAYPKICSPASAIF